MRVPCALFRGSGCFRNRTYSPHQQKAWYPMPPHWAHAHIPTCIAGGMPPTYSFRGSLLLQTQGGRFSKELMREESDGRFAPSWKGLICELCFTKSELHLRCVRTSSARMCMASPTRAGSLLPSPWAQGGRLVATNPTQALSGGRTNLGRGCKRFGPIPLR